VKKANDANLTKTQAAMVVALATTDEQWLTKSELQEQTAGQPCASAVQRGLKKLVELGIFVEERVNTQGRGYENYYSLVRNSQAELRDGRGRTSAYAKNKSEGKQGYDRGDKDLDEDGSVDIRDVLNQELIECPKCHAVLWRKDGVKHCGFVYHSDPDLWEQLPNPAAEAEEPEEAEEAEEEEEEIKPLLLVDVSGDDDEEAEAEEGESED